MKKTEDLRVFLKAGCWDKWDDLERDQAKGIPVPPLQKSYPEGSLLIDLSSHKDLKLKEKPLREIIAQRRSRRKYNDQHLSQEELAYLLWATQGIDEKNHNLRTVPSGGARHPFETYLSINRVEGIKSGLYRYIPLENKLLCLFEDETLGSKLNDICLNQKFVGKSAVVFIWTAIPYRTEWRYNILSHKIIAIDVGHLCQNLYLASESIGAGTCGVGAYRQEEIDETLGVNGEDEFTIYMASVGKIDD